MTNMKLTFEIEGTKVCIESEAISFEEFFNVMILPIMRAAGYCDETIYDALEDMIVERNVTHNFTSKPDSSERCGIGDYVFTRTPDGDYWIAHSSGEGAGIKRFNFDDFIHTLFTMDRDSSEILIVGNHAITRTEKGDYRIAQCRTTGTICAPVEVNGFEFVNLFDTLFKTVL